MPASGHDPADPSLFVKQFTAGKKAYDEGRLADAERDLEEAYLLRPRDQKVLNLLGLLYFKQEKYEKAEEIYRKLSAESPEAHTLFYNLGLIYLKLNRIEDAEMAFLKALELSRENPKISFYLGSIYEKQRRFQDAIYQYRQAGASILVRRVENKLQPGAKRARSDDDTAEFRGLGGAGPKSETDPFLVPPKPVHAVSDVLLADTAQHRPDDTARFSAVGPETRPAQAPPQTVPPPQTRPPASPKTVPPSSPDIVSFLAGLPAEAPKERTGIVSGTQRTTGIFSTASLPRPTTPAPRPAEPFRLLQTNLLEIAFSGKVYVKQGTIHSYTGNLAFWVKDKRSGTTPALVIVTGTGKLLLTDRDREISVSDLEGALCVRPAALIACQEGLMPRYIRLGEGPSAPEFVALEGKGRIAVSQGSRPLTLTVTPEQPVAVSAASVILWSGELRPQLVQDQALSEALLAPGAPAQTLVRLEGTGRVLLEQAV